MLVGSRSGSNYLLIYSHGNGYIVIAMQVRKYTPNRKFLFVSP